MTSTDQLPPDYKKDLDQILHRYLEKINTARTLFAQAEADSADNYLEYVQQTQSYAVTKGYTSFIDPAILADGVRTRVDSIGTQYGYSTPLTYPAAFRILRKLISSGKPLAKELIAQHTIQMVNSVENYLNRALYTNMASNAGQTYSGSVWASGGDSISDLNKMKANFKMVSGGQDADFVAMAPLQAVNIENDFRMQNVLYVSDKMLETGEGSASKDHPTGLKLIKDPSIPVNTALMGKKGMFGKLIITENYKTFSTMEDEIGLRTSTVFSCVDQYVLPNMLMYATSI